MARDEASRGDGRSDQMDHLKGVPMVRSGCGLGRTTPVQQAGPGQQQSQGTKAHHKSVGAIDAILWEIPLTYPKKD